MLAKLIKAFKGHKPNEMVDEDVDVISALVAAGWAEPPEAGEVQSAILSKAMQSALDPLKAKLNELVVAAGKGAGAPPPVPPPDNSAFKSNGEFLQAAWLAGQRNGHVDSRLVGPGKGHGKFTLDPEGHIKLTAGHAGESVDSAGGFLVPEQFIARIQQLQMPLSIVRPRATIIPTTTDAVSIPRLEDSDMSSTLFGGVVGYWLGEGVTAIPTRPKVGKFALKVKSLVLMTATSNQLVQDSPISVEALLTSCLSKSGAFQEDEAFYIGNGADRPHGWTGSPAVYSVARTTAGKVLIEDLAEMFARMYPFSITNAVWVMHPSVLPQLINMKNAAGDNANYVWIGSDKGMTAAPPITVLGRPVVWSMHNKTLGTANDIAFCDFSHYIVLDRQQYTIDTSTEAFFETRETAWLAEQRVDGQVWLASTIKDRQGYEMSPFVILTDAV